MTTGEIKSVTYNNMLQAFHEYTCLRNEKAGLRDRKVEKQLEDALAAVRKQFFGF